MSTQTKPQQNPNGNQLNQNPPKKQDETRKHSPNQAPEHFAPGRSNGTDGSERKDRKIQEPQK